MSSFVYNVYPVFTRSSIYLAMSLSPSNTCSTLSHGMWPAGILSFVHSSTAKTYKIGMRFHLSLPWWTRSCTHPECLQKVAIEKRHLQMITLSKKSAKSSILESWLESKKGMLWLPTGAGQGPKLSHVQGNAHINWQQFYMKLQDKMNFSMQASMHHNKFPDHQIQSSHHILIMTLLRNQLTPSKPKSKGCISIIHTYWTLLWYAYPTSQSSTLHGTNRCLTWFLSLELGAHNILLSSGYAC